MVGKVLDGKALARQIENELASRVERIKERCERNTLGRQASHPGDYSGRERPSVGDLCQDEGQCVPACRHGLVEGCLVREYDDRGAFRRD
jgi:hypothetical protein